MLQPNSVDASPRRGMPRALRGFAVPIGLIAIWQAVVWLTDVPAFVLPPPLAVLEALYADAALLAAHAGTTLSEILLGLAFGIVLGVATALAMAAFRGARDWLLPVMVASQAIPVFALAPILVLWLGFDLWPKIAMATLITYFPVAAAFYDGLRRADRGLIDAAYTLGCRRWTVLRAVRVPAALPGFATGLRAAAAAAPIGAVVGEWVGASAGLGHLMLHAKARVESPRMFAALIVLATLGVVLYLLVDRALKRMLHWQPESDPAAD
jgi:putative hydroxymethylpyrimidine transport system permease protein